MIIAEIAVKTLQSEMDELVKWGEGTEDENFIRGAASAIAWILYGAAKPSELLEIKGTIQ